MAVRTTEERVAIAQQTLDAAQDNLLALELAGPQAWVDYSVDGGSYQFRRAKTEALKSIADLQALIQLLQGPWIVRSRGV